MKRPQSSYGQHWAGEEIQFVYGAPQLVLCSMNFPACFTSSSKLLIPKFAQTLPNDASSCSRTEIRVPILQHLVTCNILQYVTHSLFIFDQFATWVLEKTYRVDNMRGRRLRQSFAHIYRRSETRLPQGKNCFYWAGYQFK